MNKPDFQLSTGRIVHHIPMANGAWDATLTDGDEMTRAEWDEYCEHCANESRRCAELRRLREAVALLGYHTNGRYDVWALAGPVNAKSRSRIMSALLGLKTPIAKSGITAIRAEFYRLSEITGGCDAEREDNFVEFCRSLGVSAKISA